MERKCLECIDAIKGSIDENFAQTNARILITIGKV
jgi:hypothetical protein